MPFVWNGSQMVNQADVVQVQKDPATTAPKAPTVKIGEVVAALATYYPRQEFWSQPFNQLTGDDYNSKY